ncbi:MAG TPA: D-alanyl-D-alanine endopeptidase, partial [Gammaproteobacteria bacterium]|nr:D-alanyl-D-alanine endopeptidase [Gammaproteobacteria bacterium]
MKKSQHIFALLMLLFLAIHPLLAAESGAGNVQKTRFSTNASSISGLIPAKILKKHLNPKSLYLHSSTALVLDLNEGVQLYGKETNKQMPIASLTKLMTAMVILDAKLDLNKKIRIKRKDRDRLRGSKSRLSYGTILTRKDMIKIALIASENRASKALARTYPGGYEAFIRQMNRKAKTLHMLKTVFKDPSGLHSGNISTAQDLVKLVKAASQYPLIRKMTATGRSYVTDLRAGWKVEFFNTNRLVRRKNWDISLSKTGYIADSGYCLVMQTTIARRDIIIVLLNSWGKLSKFGDSNRIKRWLQRAEKRAS